MITDEEYQNIKNMIVNFGHKYKGLTFDNIDETYACFIITTFNKINNSTILYNQVVDFFCKKFNFNF